MPYYNLLAKIFDAFYTDYYSAKIESNGLEDVKFMLGNINSDKAIRDNLESEILKIVFLNHKFGIQLKIVLVNSSTSSPQVELSRMQYLTNLTVTTSKTCTSRLVL